MKKQFLVLFLSFMASTFCGGGKLAPIIEKTEIANDLANLRIINHTGFEAPSNSLISVPNVARMDTSADSGPARRPALTEAELAAILCPLFSSDGR